MLRGEIGAQADDDVAGRQRKREGFGHIGTPDRRVWRSHSGARLPRPRSKCRKGSSRRFHLGETGTRERLGRRKRPGRTARWTNARSEEHTSELQSLMRISYAVICLKKKRTQ